MSKSKKVTGLGKGLGALLPSIEFSDKGFRFTDEEHEELRGSIALIDVHKINHNPYQPRKDFDKEALESLKNSILEHGVIQPIVVRKAVSGYELIAGERRLRATINGGLKKIPAYILDIDEGIDSLVLGLIENVQREDLNPIEVANGYQRLIEECHFTQEQVAAKVSKDRTTITNFLRLLRLPDEIQESIRNKELTMGHARALLALSSNKKMIQTWKEIVSKGLSVRITENLVREIESKDSSKKKTEEGKKFDGKSHVSPEIALVLKEQENKLRHLFGTQVKIHTKSKESGSVEFEFYSQDDLERLIELFISVNQD
jgi:ParB family chromosome partitioning protein